MTTATLATGNRTMTEARPRRSLEELVDRLMAALFKEEEPKAEQATETPSVAKSLHEARRLRQAAPCVSGRHPTLCQSLGLLNFSLNHWLGSEVTWGSQLLTAVIFRLFF